MNLFITFLLSVMSLSAMAQSGSVETGEILIQVAGRGGIVCSAQGMSSERLVLARGESASEAKALAEQECQKQGNEFFCKVKECEEDTENDGLVDVVFSVTRTTSDIGISFMGKVKYACTLKSGGKTFLAKAPTKVEAKVLASNACAFSRNDSAAACEVKEEDCTEISRSMNRSVLFTKIKN